MYHFFGLPPGATLAQLAAAGRSFCASSWQAVQRERAGELMAEHYCFRCGVGALGCAWGAQGGARGCGRCPAVGRSHLHCTSQPALAEGPVA